MIVNSEDQILHIVFSVLFLSFLFERGYFQAKAMKVSGEARAIKEHKGRLVAVLFLFLVAQIWVVGSFIYIIKPAFLDFTHLPIPNWIRWMGVIITTIGMSLEFSTQIHLGRNYSTTLHTSQEQTLITTGPYQSMRHPMYTALFTVGIGLGLVSASWYTLLPFLVTGIVVASRIRREEAAMVAEFGQTYIDYMQETGRFFPKIGRKKVV